MASHKILPTISIITAKIPPVLLNSKIFTFWTFQQFNRLIIKIFLKS
jgi:hypothetical protein